MAMKTAIEWTDATWNPIRGCSRVSEGCRNCYAESVAYRFSGAGLPYEGLAVLKNGHASWTGKVEFVEKHLLDPLKWKAPRRIFVNSMSDLFHENVTDEMRDKIFAVMALCPQHVFQVLTKRPERMLLYLREEGKACDLYDEIIDMADWNHSPKETANTVGKYLDKNGEMVDGGHDPRTGKDHSYFGMPKIEKWPLPNVWLGVSVENQAAADERIPLLLQTPAAVRFISAEPLLGPLDLKVTAAGDCVMDTLNRHNGLDWVICGGESGPNARPMHPGWARSLRDQCQAAGVPFFFKQWGEWGPCENGEVTPAPEDAGYTSHEFKDADRPRCAQEVTYRVGKHAAGALLDGVEWKQFPEVRA